MNSQKDQLLEYLSPLREQLLNHPLYQEINELETLHLFMEHHVFAVWDFMSLLKKLQLELTCTTIPWIPKGEPKTRRLINEIVFGEESDVDANGNTSSHYEMYISAMRSAGASTNSVELFVRSLQEGMTWREASEVAQVPYDANRFISFTMNSIESGKLHEVAASFALGREDLIPGMFTGIVRDLNQNQQLEPMLYYLERHIELDGDEHGDLAWEMLFELCGNDKLKWAEAKQAAANSLLERIQLWDGILKLSRKQKEALELTD